MDGIRESGWKQPIDRDCLVNVVYSSSGVWVEACVTRTQSINLTPQGLEDAKATQLLLAHRQLEALIKKKK